MQKMINNKYYKVIIKDIKYEIDCIHPLLELKREQLYEDIKLKFMVKVFKYIAKKYFASMLNITEYKVVCDLLSRITMNGLAYNNIIDPLFPQIIDKNVLKKELIDATTRMKIYTYQEKEQFIENTMSDIDLQLWFNNAYIQLKKYYLSEHFINNKDKCVIRIIKKKNIITIYFEDNPVFIHYKLYNKVLARFSNNFKYDKNLYIWCLCKRYNILSSFNNQLAVYPDTMTDIQKNLHINFELFGSVFNTYNKSYCSLFYDIEQYFGSHGSFFDMTIIYGNFSLNPPFDQEIIKTCISKCETYLNNKSNIFFLIWIPIWDIDGRTNFVNNKCKNKTHSTDFKSTHKLVKQFEYDGFNIIINSKFYKYIRPICSNDMTYLDYSKYKKKTVANTYMIGFSNNKINTYLLDNIIVNR
jgi:hypothetical protein